MRSHKLTIQANKGISMKFCAIQNGLFILKGSILDLKPLRSFYRHKRDLNGIMYQIVSYVDINGILMEESFPILIHRYKRDLDGTCTIKNTIKFPISNKWMNIFSRIWRNVLALSEVDSAEKKIVSW